METIQERLGFIQFGLLAMVLVSVTPARATLVDYVLVDNGGLLGTNGQTNPKDWTPVSITGTFSLTTRPRQHLQT
jgi:hypothetical protein